MFQRFISFAITAALILAGMPVFISAPAQARFPRGTAAASCPQATDNGCAAAPSNGSFKNASLLTSAQQSGQNSLLPTRAGGSLTLNIPGVDYGIGPDSTLTPQDPRTITWNSTTPCAYIGTGGNAPPNDFVGCFTAGTYPNAVLNNYDFSGAKIGKSSIPLYVNSDASAGSKITVTNSYFAILPASIAQSLGFGFLGNWSVVFKNNQCDGANATAASDFCIRDDGDLAGTTFDVRYNAFTNQNVGRVIGGLHNTALTFNYNYVRGLNDLYYLCGGAIPCNHGEVSLRTCSGGCTGSEHYEGNFVVWNTLPLGQGSINNATFFASDGASDGITLSSLDIINNIIVTNTEGGTTSGGTQVGKALFNIRVASMGAVNISGNWMDATGSTICGVNGTAQNGDGTASTSGNTINITALDSSFNNGPIEPGYLIVNPGFTTAALTAYGTGTGITGTYTFGGATQTQGSTSTWTIVPGYTGTPTLTPNWNLADPSHTGSPQAVGFAGPTMTDSNCQGAH